MQKQTILFIYGIFLFFGLLSAIFGVLILVFSLTDMFPGWGIADLLVGGLFFFFSGIYGLVFQKKDVATPGSICPVAEKTITKEEEKKDARYWLQKFLDENQNK